MPSDATLADQALAALKTRVDAFHSAVAVAEEEIRAWVSHRRGVDEYRGEQALIELGPFAVRRIDPERFAVLLGAGGEVRPESMAVLGRAEEILSGYAVGRDVHRATVAPGGDLRDTVKEALAEVGQVFGVSRAVELARSGTFDPALHNDLLGRLPFRKWNRAERRLAPPLVVEVQPDDLLPAGLGEFLDGLVTLVLVVSGPTAPAPLARLITPGTYVVQTADPADLAGLAASAHPGVGLLFDQERPEQARFVHDPDAGAAPWSRLTVHHLPERPAVGRGRRAPTWLEELDHLEALAAAPASAEVAGDLLAAAGASAEVTPDAAPADKLAAWLLHTTPLDEA